MGNVGPLVFPIDDLGRGHGEGLKAEILNKGGQKEGAAVEEEIRLPIMMKVERRRLVLDVLENAVRQPFSQSQGHGIFLAQRGRQEKLAADRGDIGGAEKRKTQFEGAASDSFQRFGRHDIPQFYRPAGGSVNAPFRDRNEVR